MKKFAVSRPLLTLLAAATLALPGAPLNAQVNLPALGDAVSQDLDVGSERRLGDQVMRQIRIDPDYVQDPLLQEYLESVWNPLVAAARKLGHIGDETQARFAWEPFLVRDKSVNAFALPGGFVYVTRGILALASDTSELAAVLAHEIAHVNRRHQWKVIQQQKLVALGEGALVRGDSARNAKVVADLGARLIARGLDKGAEFEADRDGMVIAARAGYDSSALIAVMERLEALAPGQADTAMLFSTHPSPQARIAAMTAAASPELEAAAEPSPAANRIRHAR